MSLYLNLYREHLEHEIRANCGPVTLTVDDLVSCLDTGAGLDSWLCKRLIHAKIQESADIALARTIGIAP